MTLSRTSCFGACPDYSVKVRGDGAVTYRGNAFVLITGEHHSRISRKQVEQLFAKFRGADYFSLKDHYSAIITDYPTQTTAIEFDGQKKQVVDYAGYYGGMPDVVGNLENAFDDFAGVHKWIEETGETWTALVEEHWDFRAPTSQNIQLFANVVSSGSQELIERFVNAGAPAWGMSRSSRAWPSALESAAARQNLDLVRRILDMDANIPSALLFQTLRAAAQSGNVELVRLLIAHGADVNGSPADSRDHMTVLIAATQSGNAAVVDEILLHHPDVNAKNNDARTALAMHLLSGDAKDTEHIVKALISHGASLTQTDNLGQTPLFAACTAPKAIKVLAAAGADVNARDGSGSTPLMNCIVVKEALNALLEAGADPSLQDRSGKTAALRAPKHGF